MAPNWFCTSDLGASRQIAGDCDRFMNVITETNVLVSSAKAELSKDWLLSKLGIQKWTMSFHLLNKT